MPFFRRRDRRSNSTTAVTENANKSNIQVTTDRGSLDVTLPLTKSLSDPETLLLSHRPGSSHPDVKRGLLGSLPSQVTPRRCSARLLCQRKVKLDFLPDARRASYGGREDWDVCPDIPYRNFSSDLVITGLRDGIFAADLPLIALPFGDLITRVRNCKLVLVLQKSSSLGKLVSSQRISRPFSFGYVELPIYVDTWTMDVKMATDGSDVIQLRCMTKGYLDRRYSPSYFNNCPVKSQRKLCKSISSPIMRMGRAKPRSNSWDAGDSYDKIMRMALARRRSNSN